MRNQERLEIYQLIRLSVERELEHVNNLLDIGNGGFFNYATDRIGSIVACDLMLEDDQLSPASNIKFKKGSILALPFEDNSFDVVLLQNVLHHVTGVNVTQNEANLATSVRECIRVLAPGGKLVFVESTVPTWFYHLVERTLYALLSRVWKFDHPLTFQFTRQQIAREIGATGARVVEQVIIPRGSWVIQFGLVVPTFLTPIQAVKFVARK